MLKIKLPEIKNIKLPKLNLFSKSKVSLGIEVDYDYCRVCSLSLGEEGLILPFMPFEFDILEDKDQSGLILKDELSKRSINVKTANFSIPISSTLYKNIKLPKASEKELKEAIEWNIKEDIENLKASTIFDYAILSEEEDFLNIVVVITKLDAINRILAIAESAGIEPDIIDSVGTSLVNIALLQKDKIKSHKEEKNICIVHIDRNDSFILFSKDDIFLQPLDFDIKRYETLSMDDKEQEVVRLINEINYFFLTINEPKIIYTSGYFIKFPEIKAYMQLKFSSRFILEDLDPIVALDIKYSGNFPLQLYSTSIFLAYRGIEK
ncbi:MAG: pilus assembly protein PilM [Hydrogenothermaceae bacterium]